MQINYIYDEPADYIFGDFHFYGGGSHPEQYDVFYVPVGYLKQQVGYVRLRGGRLYCSHPDVGGVVVYSYEFKDAIGEFYTEEDRVLHLTEIAEKLKMFLEGVSYEYS